LFTETGIEAAAAAILTPAERALLVRPPGSPWTATDMPLLDEARAHLGDPDVMVRVAAERRQQRADREFAERVVSSSTNAMGIQVDAGVMTERFASGPGSMAVVERAATDPNWEFGHIIVDEAQELSPMAWRMLARRCPLRSMTVVGDIAQASASWGARSWGAMLQPVAPDRWRVAELSVNYRTPSEIMAVAADVLAAVDTALEVPSSVREAGFPPYSHRVPAGGDLASYVTTVVGQAREQVGDGKLAVITPTRSYAAILAALTSAYPGEVGRGAAGLDTAIAVLTVTEAKGLEFDAVVLAEPGDWLDVEERGLRDLYVALTRATQRLDVVSVDALPRVLGRLRAVD
jgi:superfamily I DNA/RNA helicase